MWLWRVRVMSSVALPLRTCRCMLEWFAKLCCTGYTIIHLSILPCLGHIATPPEALT
jgi:hypothetical protein